LDNIRNFLLRFLRTGFWQRTRPKYDNPPKKGSFWTSTKASENIQNGLGSWDLPEPFEVEDFDIQNSAEGSFFLKTNQNHLSWSL